VVSTEISHLKLQLQTSLSERGVFEMRIGQLSDDVRRAEAERDEVRLARSGCSEMFGGARPEVSHTSPSGALDLEAWFGKLSRHMSTRSSHILPKNHKNFGIIQSQIK